MQCLTIAVLDVQEGVQYANAAVALPTILKWRSLQMQCLTLAVLELSSTGGAATSPRYVNCVDEINSVQFAYIEGVTTKLEGVTTKLLPFFDAG